MRVPRYVLALTLCAAATLAVPSSRVDLFPKLQPGQILTYEITYRTAKQTKTRSSVVLAEAPADSVSDVRAFLRLEIVGVATQGSRSVIHARSSLTILDSPTDSATTEGTAPPAIEFSILSQGGIDQITGLDGLSADQQQAWRQWASQFAAAAVFPQGGIKLSQKWKSEEAEKSPSPIAGLAWTRESTYVRNEPCRPLRLTDRGDLVESEQTPDTCAVVLTTASLKQQSKPKDATPEDYRVRELRTTGTAGGHNKTILYISLTNGLIVRASDEANQAMSVTIAKVDGTNHVHYDIEAKSVAEVLLVVAGTPPRNP